MNEFMKHDFNINKILLACFVGNGVGERIHRNRPSHGLALHTSGKKEYAFANGTRIVVEKGDIIYMPEFSDYYVDSIENGDCYAINFDVYESIGFDPFKIRVKNYDMFLNCFRKAKNIWISRETGYIMKCKAELYNILSAIEQEYLLSYTSRSKLDIIKPAVDYIHNNYYSGIISIDMLSKMCDITPEYFRSIFKSFYAASPLSYINRLKINSAKELIESGMYSISGAAEACGYADMSHFSREFKKAFGICPSKLKGEKQYK